MFRRNGVFYVQDNHMARAALSTTTATEQPLISKSKFLWGSQCRKLLWYAYKAKDQIPEPDAATQAIFDQGHEVGALAKALYSGAGLRIRRCCLTHVDRKRVAWPSLKGDAPVR